MLVSIAKSKFSRHGDDKVEKAIKPEGLVRLYDLLIQLVLGETGTRKKRRLLQEYALKGLVFRAERCFYLARSYSLAEKRMEAYALYCRARYLADDALQNLKGMSCPDKAFIEELKVLNICIEHAAGIIEEEKGSFTIV